ncbi:hypothetical protein V8E53_011585 [Lactarius tabidus]
MSLKDHSPDFDPLSFIKYMENCGRAYRERAVELVSICREFVQLGEESISQDADLRIALELADVALSSASVIKNATSVGTTQSFQEAVDQLMAYAQKYHPGQRNVTERMHSAKQKDISSSKISNKIKQSFGAKERSLVRPQVKGTTKVAQFHLLRSLSDWHQTPNVVQIEQVITEETSVEEVLWNFSRLKGDERITLKQNPSFYRGLPSSAEAYGGDFSTEPIENFRSGTEFFVLTDKKSRVFLETGEKKRVFGNLWVLEPDATIVFKDIHGRLEGEKIVEEDILRTHHLWFREEPSLPTVIPLPMRIPTIGPSSPSGPPPNPTDSLRSRTFENWKQLVLYTLNFPNISIYISTKGTPPESQDNWVLSCPCPPLC